MLPLAPTPHLFERGGLLHVVDLCVKDDGIAAFVGHGEVTPGEILDVYTDFLNGRPGRLALWDLSSATMARIDSEGIRDLAKRVAQLGSGRRDGGKAAIACGKAVDFGLARMLATYLSLDGLPVEIGVFADSDSARAWLTDEVIDV